MFCIIISTCVQDMTYVARGPWVVVYNLNIVKLVILKEWLQTNKRRMRPAKTLFRGLNKHL
jgi:hypothetical protein